MNTPFLICALLVMLLLMFLDLKYIPKMHKALKRMYFCFLIAVCGLYLGIALGLKPFMPTHWFIENVSPRVFSVIHSQSTQK